MLKNFYGKLFSKESTIKIFDRETYQKVSYSQCGEDLIVRYILNLRGINRPTYIDIGANDPYFLSNTAIFFEQGCSGINIDANPNLMDKFMQIRPTDVNLNIGIGSENCEMDFYIMNDPTLSSFSIDECRNMEKTGKYWIAETKKIRVTTISEILQEYRNGIFPDFLSLDVEGMDLEILKSIDYLKSSPKVICVEAAEYSPIGAGNRRTELIDFLSQQGYLEYANTNLNAIMVKKDFWLI
jgi:FkbM family methyltransferase